MPEMSRWTDLLNSIVPLLNSLKELVKNRRTLSIVGAIAVVMAVSVLSYILGTIQWPGASKLDPPTAASPQRIGGLDLAKYCDSYGYPEADTEYCTAGIDLNLACRWQFKQTDLRIVISNGPYSGRCIDSRNKYVGGIKDMTGYCKQTYEGSINVVAEVVRDETWACRAQIDRSLACGWQYQTEGLKAAEESAGIWACYKAQSKHSS